MNNQPTSFHEKMIVAFFALAIAAFACKILFL